MGCHPRLLPSGGGTSVNAPNPPLQASVERLGFQVGVRCCRLCLGHAGRLGGRAVVQPLRMGEWRASSWGSAVLIIYASQSGAIKPPSSKQAAVTRLPTPLPSDEPASKQHSSVRPRHAPDSRRPCAAAPPPPPPPPRARAGGRTAQDAAWCGGTARAGGWPSPQ